MTPTPPTALPSSLPLPDWVPAGVQTYLVHVCDGLSLRELARQRGCHASTVLRQVRRYENRRDDPLMDEALQALTQTGPGGTIAEAPMTAHLSAHLPAGLLSDTALQAEAHRILPLLNAPRVVLVIAPQMDRAAVLREGAGPAERLAVLDRGVAQAFVLKDWIACRRTAPKQGKLSAYGLTPAGRAMVRRWEGRSAPGGSFAAQHRDFAEAEVMEEDGPRRIRYNAAESPVSVLARKRDKDGRPYLEPDLVRAAEQIRIDFEMAQMGPRVAQNWDRFLTGADRGAFRPESGLAEGPQAARERVSLALRDLGPGLGDVVLRCCCFLEGLETAERRMGWAARSGKIVLRIALQRLRHHYDETYGRAGPRLG